LIDSHTMESLTRLVGRARQGDLDAFGGVVRATQKMAFAVAVTVLRDAGTAQDAVQDAYLTAFRRLRDLEDPGAFLSWFRRIVINAALDARRARVRRTFLQLDEAPEIPVLDETETRWTEGQRLRLARALMTLSSDERRLCDRRYHGGWTTARLAAGAGVDESAMRKRLQRIRDKLRKEIEMSERRLIEHTQVPGDLPAKIVELLARPQLTDLPESPVGQMLQALRGVFRGFTEREFPEVLDWNAAGGTIARDAIYIEPGELHRIDDSRILRYDLTLPLLMQVRYEGTPLRIFSSGKTYRACEPDPTHLEAFHQAEVFCLDERARLDKWQLMTLVLQSVEATMPGLPVRLTPTSYSMCSQAWDVDVEQHGRWWEVIAFGVFTDRVVSHLGADPKTHTAIGAGYGLERLAMLRYGIDDIRKMDVTNVA
jgi:RNA polymerase sigma factor (sigma-70 family)